MKLPPRDRSLQTGFVLLDTHPNAFLLLSFYCFMVMFYASKAPFLLFVLFHTFSTPHYELTTVASFFCFFILVTHTFLCKSRMVLYPKSLHSIALFPFRSIFISMHILRGSLCLYAGT